MDERVAIVTGGGRGIGLACVHRLLADGYRVAVVDINKRAMTALQADPAVPAGCMQLISASVTDRAAMAQAVQGLLERWGRVDALVNNAGINKPGGITNQTDADWAAVIDVNLTGPFVCSAVAAAAMQRQGGAIVHVGSIGAAGMGASPAYAASKAGLIGLTRQMARELGPDDITVNLVAPGVTLTDWVERNLGAERVTAAAASAPLRRAGTPEDIAGVISFLLSQDARHITGQVLSASGGAWMP
jgi:NAD(P)-dependent dehydrogenase (short-subunit alcohol dehydrogenase family)